MYIFPQLNQSYMCTCNIKLSHRLLTTALYWLTTSVLIREYCPLLCCNHDLIESSVISQLSRHHVMHAESGYTVWTLVGKKKTAKEI